jgi:HK97 family phage prohead protease
MKRKNGAAGPEGFQPGGTMARELSFAPNSYSESARTVEGVFAAGSPVRRYGFVETLNMDAGAVDLSRVGQGQCKLLDSHNSYSIDSILGVVETARIENGQLVGRVRFAETDAGRKAEGMVARGELTGFSIGYSIQKWTNVSQEDSGLETWRADQWSLLEVTLCAVPADPVSTVRAVATVGNAPGSQASEEDMTRSAPAAAAAAAVENTPAAQPAAAPASAETRATPQAAPAPQAERAAPTAAPAPAAAAAPTPAPAAQALTPARAIALANECAAFGQREVAERLIGEGRNEDEIRRAVMQAVADAARANQIGTPRVSITRDEGETRLRGIEDALAFQLGDRAAAASERAEPSELARPFMRSRSLVEFAADYRGHNGRLGGFADREELLRSALTHSTSDFPNLLENAINRALRARYVVAAPTYRAIAQQRTYMDFRDHISVRDGDFPQLKEVGEGGEIPGGTFGESKEKTAVKPYAVQVGFTRQLLINDNLGGIQRVLNSRAEAVARFEEETFYTMMLSAAGAGPTLLETGRAVFNTTDKTLASANAAIANAAIGIGRAAMRTKKTKDGTFLNITPAILLVGPDKETEAQGVLSPLYAAQASNVPLFASLLRLVVSAQITGNAWYLFADPAAGANFEWGLLEGYGAPRMRIDEPFGRQGMSVSLEHDFGCGAIDYRFAYRNAGA